MKDISDDFATSEQLNQLQKRVAFQVSFLYAVDRICFNLDLADLFEFIVEVVAVAVVWHKEIN